MVIKPKCSRRSNRGNSNSQPAGMGAMDGWIKVVGWDALCMKECCGFVREGGTGGRYRVVRLLEDGRLTVSL